MEGAGGTASLRKAAAHWSLAGDRQLLDLLQNLHERIVTKCQEANSGLEEMVNTLDSASIGLQNVNNRLMALSNSQFVESRVYEDDVDVAAKEPPVKEGTQPSDPIPELSRLQASLQVLETYHEPVHILDSDSESGSDDEGRMVFKPKDLYTERPLPYIIGSQQWRSKWHAGLVAEESDSDSDTSKVNPPSDQYSDSEPEGAAPETGARAIGPHASQRTISTTSSLGSERATQADVASELARRLAGGAPQVPEPEPEPPVAVAPTKVYRPPQPTTATIFSDEPPPLDPYQSEHSEPDEPDQSDSEDDVFAELHRQSHRQTRQLFGNVPNVQGRKSDFATDVDRGPQTVPGAKQPSPLFKEPQDSELFSDKPKGLEQPVYTETQTDISIKKPVGGISLFGNNHGTESIGAAILKRNQRKASTSDEEGQEPQKVNKFNDSIEQNKMPTGQNSKDNIQKDIINDLFSKPSKVKASNKKIEKQPAAKMEKPVVKKVDLFNDDLFDDIDDIFTNVKPPAKETKQSTTKSLFDDDDDDLFANVATTSNKINSKSEPKSKSIFDSDDDLFNEEIVEKNAAKLKYNQQSNKVPVGISNDDLFSEEIHKSKKDEVKIDFQVKTDQNATAIENYTGRLKTEYENSIVITKNSEGLREEVKSPQDKSSVRSSQVKSIFDSDSDDDIFTGIKSGDNNSVTPKSDDKNAHNINNKTQISNKIDEYTVRKLEPSSNIPHSIHNENELNIEKDDFIEEDSLFKETGKPIHAKTMLIHNENNDTENNVNIYTIDNNKKTDEPLTESLNISSEIESNSVKDDNTIIYTDKFLSSTNSNENSILSKEVSSNLSNTNVRHTLNSIHSPSLFDEDDDFDDMFNNSSDTNKSTKTDNKLEHNSSNQSSKFTVNEDNIHEKRRQEDIISKSDNYIASSNNSNLVENVTESISHKDSDKDKKQVLENYKEDVFKNDSEDFKYENNTNNVSNSQKESELPLPKDVNKDNSIHIPNESILEEEKENKTDDDNISEDFIQRENLFSNIKDTVLGEPDIFSDIFSDIPPDFERPKEPKRSKNVNALFDDDSDDEALFFKKNEIVSDEKPDVGFSSPDDRLFHIFHDEPPAIDVDFTQKTKKSLETPDSTKIESQTDMHGQTNVKSLFNEAINKEKTGDTFVDSESDKITDDTRKPVGKLKPVNFNINVNSLLPGASPKKTKTYEQVDGQVISSKIVEDVVKEESGMVKSVSFEGDPESEILDNKLSKERVKIQVKRRPSTRRARKEAVRKSGIDFGDDSTDTSTSTDVPKKDKYFDKTDVLQTDNNTTPSEKHTNTATTEDVLVDKTVVKDLDQQNFFNHNEITDLSDFIQEKQVTPQIEQDTKKFKHDETNISDHIENTVSSTSDNIKQDIRESSNLATTFNKRPNVKSKVVYILNDEDIFTDTKPVTNLSDNIHNISDKVQNNEQVLFKDKKTIPSITDNTQNRSENTQNVKNKVLNIIDDDDELFKSGASKSGNASTLGNLYKDVTLKNNEIVDLDSDEDIFKASQSKSVRNNETIKSSKNKNEIDKIEAKIDKLFVKSQNTKVKSSLFDDLSDEESELFGSKKDVKNLDTSDNSNGISTIIKKEVKLSKNDVKTSLFGDDSDGDDLFGVKTTKKVLSQPMSKPKEGTSIPAEPVFEDPLSILTQEDDI